MSMISIFNASFCGAASLVRRVSSALKYQVITDEDIVRRCSEESKISTVRLMEVFSGAKSFLNPYTLDKEHSIALLQASLAEMLMRNSAGSIVHGFCAHLLPRTFSHVLRVCLIAERRYRAKIAARRENIGEEEAMAMVRQDDKVRSAWVQTLFANPDPWDASFYDMVLPVDKMSAAEVLGLIKENMVTPQLKPADRSAQAMEDFLLTARVTAALAKAGHKAGVHVSAGEVTITTGRQVILFERLEEELKGIISGVKGIHTVRVEAERSRPAVATRQQTRDGKVAEVLLVDDEREFVQTLSERLNVRGREPMVAYDGESALGMVQTAKPEVMILDLKMPGIDGFEVLKQIKQTRPDIEVIILTGHGNELDRQQCLELGAFAYLEKPLDIDLLIETLRRAQEKISKV